MYVCICHAVTEREVREAAAAGVRTLTELTFRTGCAGGCGSCARHAENVLQESRASRPQPFLSVVEA
jgi:bacterioferritin-associated ferredoxin